MSTTISPANDAPFNIRAAAWAIGLHLLLLLLLFVLVIDNPVRTEPLQEMGMEVNLGTSDNGSGADQPMDMDDPSPTPIDLARNAVEPADVPEIMRGNDEHEVATPAVTRNRTAVVPAPANTRPAQTAPQKPKYTYTDATGSGGNRASANAPGTSEGNTTGPGDRGVPGGTPGSPNYSGSPGPGTGGFSHSISGRSLVSRPDLSAEYREGGTVVFFITINRDGNIVSSRVKRSASAELTAIARRKLQDVRFNKSPGGPPEQSGDFIFRFSGRRSQ